MPKGISLHIGVNRYDPAHYSSDSTLNCCENDAIAMQSLAESLGYSTNLLLSEGATISQLARRLNMAANQLRAGDIFFITFSGHGSRRTDYNGDEDDAQDETWCLYDQQLIDDQLQFYWRRFRQGVRIVMVSDSCHSGTINKDADGLKPCNQKDLPTPRLMPVEYTRYANNTHKAVYKSAQLLIDREAHLESPIPASLLLLSGCQDDEFSYEIADHGCFTKALIDCFERGDSQQNYQTLFENVSNQIAQDQAHWDKEQTQTPNLVIDGRENLGFINSQPFSI